MKTTKLYLLGIVIASFALATACQRNAHENIISNAPASPQQQTAVATTGGSSSTGKQNTTNGPCNSYAYTITLESHTAVNGGWEWVWSVQNPNPGNGSNGTVQNLSHWGMQFGTCFNFASVTGAAYSADGITWTSFTPVVQSDPSQSCMTTPVLKFDFGTTGSNKSYYKLIVNTDYIPAQVPGYYKSGTNTGCCTFLFDGIGGCGDGDGPR